MDEPLDVRSDADAAGEAAERARDRLEDATRAARAFGSTLAEAMKGGAAEGRRFEDVLKGVAQRLLAVAADSAARMIGKGLDQGLKGLLGGLGGPFAGAGGPSFTAGGMALPDLAGGLYAKGGIVGGPTLFPMPAGLGLMGEAGAEAILPLARGPDGRLGIRASETEIAAPVSVVVNVTTPDAASFRRSESSVSAALARAVARGRRTL